MRELGLREFSTLPDLANSGSRDDEPPRGFLHTAKNLTASLHTLQKFIEVLLFIAECLSCHLCEFSTLPRCEIRSDVFREREKKKDQVLSNRPVIDHASSPAFSTRVDADPYFPQASTATDD